MITPLSVGIDSGKNGAIVALDPQRRIVLCEDTPVITSTTGTTQYDRPAMTGLIKRLLSISAGDSMMVDGIVSFLIEEPITKPQAKAPHKCKKCGAMDWLMKFDKPSVIAAQWSGFVLWEGILVGMQEFCPGLSYTHVKPAAWHNELFGKVKGGDPKIQAYNHVTSQWPGGAWQGPRGGERDGRWDAGCLADVQHRRLVGASHEIHLRNQAETT